MRIGVPKEIKADEFRVALTPASVKQLIDLGHQVIVETNAGAGVGFSNDDYRAAGAEIVDSAQQVFQQAKLIVKVKEPQPRECKQLNNEQILFTYLHLAADPLQAELLLQSGCSAIAYETVTNDIGYLPLLAPMSAIAGRLATQASAYHLQKPYGGSGILLSGMAGAAPANVTIIGGGMVGTNALEVAVGMGANVTVFDRSPQRLKQLNTQFSDNITTIEMDIGALEKNVVNADVVIGAALVAGDTAPKLLTRDMLDTMRDGSVVVDVSIDQGGCFEGSHPTTHQDPVFLEEGIIHYCVANMPSAVPRTATLALNHITLPFVTALANKGIKQALLDDQHFLNGLNVSAGHITHTSVANALNKPFVSPQSVLNEVLCQ